MTGTIADLLGPGKPEHALDEILHAGAQRMLAEALMAEVEAYIQARAGARDDEGRRLVVRNGYLPEREIVSPVGRVTVQQPRVRDHRGADEVEKFTSSILPRYMRRSPKLDELIPWLYLRGVSTSDMLPALEALVGPTAKGLSASTVTRLTEQWTAEWDQWRKRELTGREYVYIWADGIHVNVRLEEDRQCFLVLMGATADGRKELIAVLDGHRESEQSWYELLVDVKKRGLTMDPKLAIADGALGFWKALKKVYPTTRIARSAERSSRSRCYWRSGGGSTVGSAWNRRRTQSMSRNRTGPSAPIRYQIVWGPKCS
jgi:transposase-like protein